MATQEKKTNNAPKGDKEKSSVQWEQVLNTLLLSLAPMAEKMGNQMDAMTEDFSNESKAKAEDKKLDLEQKRRWGVPDEKKVFLSLKVEALDLRRKAVRDPKNKKALLEEAEVIETFLIHTDNK